MLNRQTVTLRDGMKYDVIRKNIKNINLHINRNGEITVSAPLEVSLKDIETFVCQKKNWILKHLGEVEKRKNDQLITEEEIVLFGNRLKIKTMVAAENQISYDDTCVYVLHHKTKKTHTLIQDLLNQLCHDVFHDITKMTIRKMRNHPTAFPDIKIRTMKSQWGNCHPNQKYITLNRNLIHYPFEFIEYVVLHELTHFHVQNHSSDFYQIVENYMPDYKKRIQLIK